MPTDQPAIAPPAGTRWMSLKELSRVPRWRMENIMYLWLNDVVPKEPGCPRANVMDLRVAIPTMDREAYKELKRAVQFMVENQKPEVPDQDVGDGRWGARR